MCLYKNIYGGIVCGGKALGGAGAVDGGWVGKTWAIAPGSLSRWPCKIPTRKEEAETHVCLDLAFLFL